MVSSVGETLAAVFRQYLVEETDYMLEQGALDARFYAGDKGVVWYLPGLDVVIQNVDGGIKITRPEHLPNGNMKVSRA
jgi:hypothetical protein